MKHVTVLHAEAVDALNLKSDSVVVDATLGSGGHGAAICAKLGSRGTYVGIDADHTAVESFRARSTRYDIRTHLECDNFRNIADVLDRLHIDSVDAILADHGL